MRLVQDSAMICELLFIYLVLRRLEISEDLFEISVFFFFKGYDETKRFNNTFEISLVISRYKYHRLNDILGNTTASS